MVTDGARIPLSDCYQVVSRMPRNVSDFLSEMSLIKLGQQTLCGVTHLPRKQCWFLQDPGQLTLGNSLAKIC